MSRRSRVPGQAVRRNEVALYIDKDERGAIRIEAVAADWRQSSSCQRAVTQRGHDKLRRSGQATRNHRCTCHFDTDDPSASAGLRRESAGQATLACPALDAMVIYDDSFDGLALAIAGLTLAITGSCLGLLKIGLGLRTRVRVKRCQVIEQRLSSTQLRTIQLTAHLLSR